MKAINRTRVLFAIYDLLLVCLCTLITAYLHHTSLSPNNLDKPYILAFFLFPWIWLLLSIVTKKFRIGDQSNHWDVFLSVLFSNFIILSVTTIIMVLFHFTYFSRFILFGTIAGITFFEIITGHIYVSIQKSVFLKDWIGIDISKEQKLRFVQPPPPEVLFVPRDYGILRESMIEEVGVNAFTWISGQVDILDQKCLMLSTDTRFNVINYPNGIYSSFVNLQQINNLRRMNKFFETVNTKLTVGGIFIGCGETYTLRKQRILAALPPVINYFVYSIDFIINRVGPKLVMTRKLYFLITRGKKRVISRTETLGRLYSCGFEVLEEKSIGGLLYWKSRKTREPLLNDSPTYGIFVRLRRIGKNGKEFNVYKLRTMHAYAEHIQGFVYDKNHLDDGGKFKDDFRVTTIGRILRKFWLDELPMLINVVKGDMKIVGVRPLSKHFFGLYSEELQKRRVNTKPGLIPPYYAQYPTPVSLQDVQDNENDYLTLHEKNPFKTDVTYFFKAMHNIFWRHARSK